MRRTAAFSRALAREFIVAIVQPIGQKLMARVTRPLQIDLRFRDTASELIDAIAGRLASNFSGDRLGLFGLRWIRKNR